MTQKTINETFDTPVTRGYDVVVAGGGPAGCCAALAAARGGAKTLVIERNAFLGGMLTGGMVGSSGLYTVAPSSLAHYAEIRRRLGKDPDSVQLIKGIPREIMRRLIETGGGAGYLDEVPAYVCVHVPSLKLLLLKMMEEAGVDIVFYAQGVRPLLDGNTVSGVIIQGKGDREAVEAKVVVDATGDGDIAASAGAEYCFGRAEDGEAINMTVMFSIGGIDMHRYFASEVAPYPDQTLAWPPVTSGELLSDMLRSHSYWLSSSGDLSNRPQIPAELRDEIDKYTWSSNHSRGHIFACPSPIRDELYINVTEVFKKDGTDSWQITDAIKESHKQMELTAKMYKLAVPGFENSYIREVAPLMGIRETRRITGDYVLNGDDVRACRKFADGIAGSGHPIDISEDNKGVFEKLQGGEWFDVPYRSILVKDMDGIITAGRCISTDHDALGAVRPTATCMALGEAAGTAAGMAVARGVQPRKLDGVEVRKKIGWAEGVDILSEIESEVDQATTLQRSS